MTTLRTPSLGLPPLAPCDRDTFVRLYSDPGTMSHLGGALSPEGAALAFDRALTATQHAGTQTFWSVRKIGLEEPMGVMGLTRRPGSGEVGIVLDASCRGREYAAEALAALADHVFDVLALPAFTARHAASNISTARLLSKLGFKAAGDPDSDPRAWTLSAAAWAPYRPRWRGL